MQSRVRGLGLRVSYYPNSPLRNRKSFRVLGFRVS